MSPTMVVSSTTTTFLTGRLSCCPSCGFDIVPPELDPTTQLLESQARIVELETQVCLLNQRLRAQIAAAPRISSSSSTSSSSSSLAGAAAAAVQSVGEQQTASSPRPATRGSLFQSGASRISALVYNRASRTSPRPTSTSTSTSTTIPAASTAAAEPAPASAPASTPPPRSAATSASPSTSESPLTQKHLLEALEREQSLRRAAENRLSATSKEVEELSAALFEQANEMVADERRARAKLEQRVGELEKRDVDKRRRLERLETAVVRIERARTLLLESPDGGDIIASAGAGAGAGAGDSRDGKGSTFLSSSSASTSS